MHQEPLQIIQDNKFYSFLLSKESLASNPSFRVTTVAVPFLWESQPGTPKHTVAAVTVQPLTPPPSSYFISSKKKIAAMNSRSPKNKLFSIILPKLRKPTVSSLSSSSSSSSWLPSNSQALEERGGRRGCNSMGFAKNMLLEMITCAKLT